MLGNSGANTGASSCTIDKTGTHPIHPRPGAVTIRTTDPHLA